ncbi:MAG: intracellular septation protein A [Gammaproteobacteria bacterium]|nr:MAG: intracellular septation protein A [Gammaproteobacteria bacterium]PIE39295.1 MAG: intracellular septation protein A [Gammaproteobacteria bacterium]
MKQLLEFLPIVLFFVTYQMSGKTIAIGDWQYTLDGIFSATLVLMISSAITLVITRVKYGHIEKREWFMLGTVLLLGGATVLLRDQTFIFWKPTVFNWVLAIAFGASQFIGEKNLLQRALGSQLDLPKHIWMRLNMLWVANFTIVGALNLVVAYGFGEATWVSYKLYSSIGFTLLVTIATFIVIAPHIKEQGAEQPNGNEETQS